MKKIHVKKITGLFSALVIIGINNIVMTIPEVATAEEETLAENPVRLSGAVLNAHVATVVEKKADDQTSQEWHTISNAAKIAAQKEALIGRDSNRIKNTLLIRLGNAAAQAAYGMQAAAYLTRIKQTNPEFFANNPKQAEEFRIAASQVERSASEANQVASQLMNTKEIDNAVTMMNSTGKMVDNARKREAVVLVAKEEAEEKLATTPEAKKLKAIRELETATEAATASTRASQAAKNASNAAWEAVNAIEIAQARDLVEQKIRAAALAQERALEADKQASIARTVARKETVPTPLTDEIRAERLKKTRAKERELVGPVGIEQCGTSPNSSFGFCLDSASSQTE